MNVLLSLIVFLPLAGAVALLFIGNRDGRRNQLIRQMALGVSLLTFVATLALWARFDGGSPEFQFVERRSWIPVFGIEYFIGVDGISLMLIVLTGFLTPLALLSSWGSIERKVKEFSIFLLVLETAMLGVFVALDLFLFYVFWDAMLIPMYFLIGIWGYERRIYAAVKFILYTLAGSVLMLVAIIGLAYMHSAMTGVYTFDVLRLYGLDLPRPTQDWLFLAFAVAFLIKVPVFPFHTWLPDAHVEAPTAGSVILAGVLLKMGGYGLIRFAFPLFPEAALAYAPYIALLAVIGIIYGALVAMVQPDLKKLVAYSSVSHLGFVVLGICAMNVQGLQGAIFQMVAHGVTTGALFLIVGMLSDRRHTRLIAEFGGLKTVMPRLTMAFLIITLASIALPSLNGFIGEFLILVGAFRWDARFASLAATGVILSAVYMLWMFQRVNHGAVTNEKNRNLPDLTAREWWVLGPTVVMAIVMGVVPMPFLRPMEASVEVLVQRVGRTQPVFVRNAECGMRNGESGVRNAEWGTRNTECGMRSAEWGTRNAEGRMRNAEYERQKAAALKSPGPDRSSVGPGFSLVSVGAGFSPVSVGPSFSLVICDSEAATSEERSESAVAASRVPSVQVATVKEWPIAHQRPTPSSQNLTRFPTPIPPPSTPDPQPSTPSPQAAAPNPQPPIPNPQ